MTSGGGVAKGVAIGEGLTEALRREPQCHFLKKLGTAHLFFCKLQNSHLFRSLQNTWTHVISTRNVPDTDMVFCVLLDSLYDSSYHLRWRDL